MNAGLLIRILCSSLWLFGATGAQALTCQFSPAPATSGPAFAYSAVNSSSIIAYNTGSTISVVCNRSNSERQMGIPQQGNVFFEVSATVSTNGASSAPHRKLVRTGGSGGALDFLWYSIGANACSDISGPYDGATNRTLVFNNAGAPLSFSSNMRQAQSGVFRVCAKVAPHTSGSGPVVNEPYPTAAVGNTYTDTFQLVLSYSYKDAGGMTVQGSPVTATVQLVGAVTPSCTLNSNAFSMPTVVYPAFSPVAQTASISTPAVRCTNTTPWTLQLSDYNSNTTATYTLRGLQYNLRLKTTNPLSAGMPSLSGTGNGAFQGVAVTATFPPAQAGGCNPPTDCSSSTALHTLVLSN